MTTILSIIDKKRRGETHTDAELNTLIEGVMSGIVPDYQLAAWLMAVCIQGLNLDETVALTRTFVDSGMTLSFGGSASLSSESSSDMDSGSVITEQSLKKRPVVVDKHSTGGVGDKTTLILVPLLAVCGVKVAKLSGRGLGFTGGTIDKLEAIPNFNTALSTEVFKQHVNTLGMAISSQTEDLTPADGKLYALRDVTGTVDSIPLIAASVVSKKIATGADVIVLDIKVGAGAFVKTLDDAQQLADWCRQVGERFGRKIATVITSMDVPLGNAIGNAVEVQEAIDTLQGHGPADLLDVTLELGAVALVAAQEVATVNEGRKQLQQALDDGSAYQAFLTLVNAQSGSTYSGEDTVKLPQSLRCRTLPAPQSGVITAIDCLGMAKAVKLLGGGRQQKGDDIDLTVGVLLRKKLGDTVNEGETLLTMHSSGKNDDEAWAMLQEAILIGDAVTQKISPLILETTLPSSP